MPLRFISFFALSLAFTLTDWNAAYAAEPATIAEASERLDLVTLPLIAGSDLLSRREASLSYTVMKQSTADVFEFVDNQLTARGWRQLPGARSFPDQGFSSAEYAHGDYVVQLSVYPHGDSQPGVTISHQGNIPIAELPAPDSLEKQYAFTATVTYRSAGGVTEAAKDCQESMRKAGWSPYGEAGDSAYYRKNGVLASVRTISAPAQGGATVINYAAEMLSVELPAPTFGDGLSYSDGDTAIGFDCDKTPQEVADFYRDKLGPLGWKATTDQPVKIDWKLLTIFRNSGQEMITLSTHKLDGRTRVFIDHENAVEVAQNEYRTRSVIGEKATHRNNLWINVQVAVPADLIPERTERWAVRFATPKQGAVAAAETIATTLAAGGWESKNPKPKEPVFQSRRFEKEGKTIWLMSIEPPKRNAWVAIIGIGGVEFQLTH